VELGLHSIQFHKRVKRTSSKGQDKRGWIRLQCLYAGPYGNFEEFGCLSRGTAADDRIAPEQKGLKDHSHTYEEIKVPNTNKHSENVKLLSVMYLKHVHSEQGCRIRV
jgi:hypothetical protein